MVLHCLNQQGQTGIGENNQQIKKEREATNLSEKNRDKRQRKKIFI